MTIESVKEVIAAAQPVSFSDDAPAQGDQGADRAGPDGPPDYDGPDGPPDYDGPDGPPDYDGPDGPPDYDGSGDMPPEYEGLSFDLNDYGNGRRLMLYFGSDLVFVPRLAWHRWTGKRWRADEDEIQVRAAAQQVAAKIKSEADYISASQVQREILDEWDLSKETYQALCDAKKKDELAEGQAAEYARLTALKAEAETVKNKLAAVRKAHRDFAKSSGNSGKIKNMLIEATVEAARTVDQLNSDPLRVNCENGTIVFEDGPDGWRARLDPHDRRDMITKICRANYDPRAVSATWLSFIRRVQPDPDMQMFLQRWFGYSLLGLTSEQKLVFLFGGGRNGKSTAVDAIAKILNDYATTLPIETLTGGEQRKGSDATPDLVRLPGARMVRASEPEQGQKMKEALIKALTGGEPMLVRRMMQEFVEVVPEFKLTISGNHKPEVRGADDGIWRRILLVEFAEQIPESEVDPLLPQKLAAEADGILSWLVQGALDYLTDGLRPPADVARATAEYREESDPLRVFLLSECTIDGGNSFVPARILALAFQAWQMDDVGQCWTARTVATGIKARAENVKGEGGHVFRAVKRSTTGYSGIRVDQAAIDRIARHSKALGLETADVERIADLDQGGA